MADSDERDEAPTPEPQEQVCLADIVCQNMALLKKIEILESELIHIRKIFEEQRSDIKGLESRLAQFEHREADLQLNVKDVRRQQSASPPDVSPNNENDWGGAKPKNSDTFGTPHDPTAFSTLMMILDDRSISLPACRLFMIMTT